MRIISIIVAILWTMLLINHIVRDLFWYPLVIVWFGILVWVRIEGSKF